MLGYKLLVDYKPGGDLNEALRQQIQETTTVALRLEDMIFEQLQDQVRRAESLFFEKEKQKIRIGLHRDERGKLRVTVTGPKSVDPKVLEAEGRTFVEEIARAFALNRVAGELEKLNCEVVEEVEVKEEGEIRLKITRWS